jgi:cell division transport system permease protein
MGMFTNGRRIVKAGFVNFWRNAVVSLSAILVMTVALFVVGSTMLISAFLDSTIEDIRGKVDINIYFSADAAETEILGFRRDLEALPEVKSVEYISRDLAIEQFKLRHANDNLMMQAIEELPDNPLGAILNVKAKDPANYEAIAKYIDGKREEMAGSGEQLIYSVNYAKNKVIIDKLTKITAGVERVSAAVLLLLLSIAVVITFNTIRLAIYVSREEIAIMRLVGANNSFVRGPFIVEGMIYGMVASLISTGLFYPATLWLRGATDGFYGGIDMFGYYLREFNQIFLILLAVGVTLGALSSWLAVRRYLKV